MDGWVVGEGQITLYGVVLKAMQEAETFAELRREVQNWVYERYASRQVCTMIEKTGCEYKIVVRFYKKYQDLLDGIDCEVCKVSVTADYNNTAKKQYYEQSW